MKFEQIEKASKSEYSRLIAIWEAAVRATHSFLNEDDIQYFKPLILNEYLDAVQLFSVAAENEMIAGFMGLSEEKIEMLFVDPAFFGRGVGTAFVEFAIRNGIRRVDVNEQNPQAVGFYLHMGFAIADRSEFDDLGKPFPILHLQRN